MSQWTHVCGCIRIDSFSHNVVNNNLEKIFGKTLRYESAFWEWEEQENFPELYTPTGSEGGVLYNVWENPESGDLASHTISIWGDLRDYDDVNELIEWFQKICKAFFIRDAVLNIKVEYQKSITVIFDGAKKPCRVIEKEWEE